MQPTPPYVADERSQPRAEADGESEIESNDTRRHPQWSIMTDEGDKDFVPAKAGKGVNPDCQHVDAGEDQRQQSSKIVQFAVEQARPPARRLPLQGQRQPYRDREGEQDISGKAARARYIPGNRLPDAHWCFLYLIR